MITYLDISIFDSPAQTLVNTVNTVGIMGKGIAATFKKLYPDMYQEYKRLCEERKFDVGKLYIYRTQNKIVVNFPTKMHWRYPSRLEYIESGLKKFVARYNDYGISSVSFPQLGCGHGELDWANQVHPLMEKYLEKLPIPVYIHLYEKQLGFVPERLDNEYSKQVNQERERISVDQLWKDLENIINNDPKQFTIFGPAIEITGNSINFVSFSDPATENPKEIFREDIEYVWNILRNRGTISENEFPVEINQINAGEDIYELLSQLKYIKPTRLKSKKNDEFVRGLRYDPQPAKILNEHDDIVI